MDRRRLLLILATAGLVLLACAPAVVTFALGWLKLPHIQASGAAPARDTSSPEAWTLFAVFYLGWTIALVILLIWSYDRLDYHWRYHERSPRPTKKGRRRLAATMKMFEAEERAREAAKRSARAPRAPSGKPGKR
jgi:hypothetical protein